jgi:YidC/Oxa1 family membrane protein insertase
MAQQQSRGDRTKTLLTMLVLWGVGFYALQTFGPKPPPPPAVAQNILADARKLDAEARKDDPNVALGDRVKKAEQAINKYEEYYNANKKAPDAAQARFNQINLYDFLARLEGPRVGTKWYDQAEHKLKDMEGSLHNRTGTVKVEVNKEVLERTGDLGQIASDRLNKIRQDRDVVNQKLVTFKILDFLVGLTGHNPNYSYFIALLIVVVFVKTVTFPFQKKQYKYQKDLTRIQPYLKEMQEQYKDRPAQEIQQRQMELYKEHNVNLMGGCLPMLVLGFGLIPVYWMVRDYEFQFTHAKFLWIGSSLSHQYWWLADNLAQFDAIMCTLYILTSLGYSLIQPKPADEAQAKQQRMMMVTMPLMFGVMMFFWRWSSAFLLYWSLLSLVSIYQGWLLNRQFAHTDAGGNPGAPPVPGAPAPVVPVAPLPVMKGVPTKKPEGSKGRRVVRRPGTSGRS